MANESSTRQLKRVLGFKELLSTALGQVIGAGIMTLLGIAVGMTGRSIILALLVSAVIILTTAIPMIIFAGTVRVRGGYYTMLTMVSDKRFAGMYIILNVMQNVSLAMYPLAFADYFASLFGFGSVKVIALLVLTLFFVVNIVGVDVMAKFQNIIVVLMCVALALFAALGVRHIQPDFFTNGFFTGGTTGFLGAAAVLTFAVGGAQVIVSLSGEAKNPTRDIPMAMIIGTLAVTLLYCVIAAVASGVLPVEQVANQNLSAVAQIVLSKPLYIFFMVFGAMFALISTLNAQFATCTKPLLQACDDGWLPRKFGYLHPKFKTPVVLLSIIYGITVLCIVTGLSMDTLANITLISNAVAGLPLYILLFRLPKVVPDAWAKSKFRVSMPVLMLLTVLGTAGCIFVAGFNAFLLSTPLLIGNVVMIVAAIIFGCVRVKKVEMDVSYEAVD